MKRTQLVAAVLVIALSAMIWAAGCGVEEAREAGECAAGQNNGSEKGTRSGEGAGSEAGSAESEDTSQVSETTKETPPAETTEDVAEVTESTSRSPRVLADKWYVDSDGNKVPDFIEVEKGYDPKVDDCAKEVDCPGPSGASGGASLITREQNTLLILDSSGSMAAGDGTGGGKTKMQAAKGALEQYVTGTPDFVNLGFMVYGHEGSNAESDREESCAGIDVPDPVGEVDYESFPQTLESFQPTGWTPIAGSLERAAEEFEGKQDAENRVVLVTDGLETCGGDPVAAARSLDGEDISVTIDVVGFDIGTSEEQEALRQIAEVTGGEYYDAQTGADLQEYFEDQRRVKAELVDQSFCLMRASNKMWSCNTNFGTKTYFHMSDIAGDKLFDENDQAAQQTIYEIMDRAQDYNDRITAENSEQLEKRQEEIGEDIDEAERRMEARYNEDVSYAPSCPASPVYASLRPQVTIAQGYLQ